MYHLLGSPRAEEQAAQDGIQGRMTDRQELSLLLEIIKDAVDSYIETLSHQSLVRYKLPPVSIQYFKAGVDWKCFAADFKDMMRLADLKSSHQLVHLKQAVPEEP